MGKRRTTNLLLWANDKRRQREHREKQKAAESRRRDQQRHNSEMARIKAKEQRDKQASRDAELKEKQEHNSEMARLKEEELQELRKIKEAEQADRQRHSSEMVRLKEEENREAVSAREAEKQEREKVRALKQEIFDLRESLKKACKIADVTQRHDRLFDIRRDAASIDMSTLEDLADKQWHSETLEILDENLSEAVAELGVDRTELMEDLFSSCREVGELCCRMTETETRARRGRANTSGEVHAISAIEDAEDFSLDAEDLFLARENQFGGLEELIQRVEDRTSELGVDIEFLPEDLQQAFGEAVRRQRDWRDVVFGFQRLIMLARVDGEINPCEMRFLQDWAQEHLISPEEADRLIQETKCLNRNAFSGNEDDARGLIEYLYRMAGADDEIDPKETQLIARIGDELGLSQDVMEETFGKAKAGDFDYIVEFQCLILLAKNNGEIGPAKWYVLRDLASACGINPANIDRIVHKTNALDRDLFSGSEDAAKRIVTNLHRLAASSGRIDVGDMVLIDKIGKDLGLSPSVMADVSKEAKLQYFDPIITFQCLILLAKSNGEIDPEEMNLLWDFARACGIGGENLDRIIHETDSLTGKAFSGDKSSAKRIIKGLYKIAAADDNIDPREIELVGKIAHDLGLSPDLVEGVSRAAKAEYFDHIFEFQCFVLLARSDGQIVPEETALIHEVALAYGIDPERRDRLIQETRSLNPKAFSGKEDVAKRIVQNLYQMSLADGKVSADEAKWIGKIGSAIGLSTETIKGIITETKEAAKRADEEARRSQLESILVPNPDYKPSRRASVPRGEEDSTSPQEVVWGCVLITVTIVLIVVYWKILIFPLVWSVGWTAGYYALRLFGSEVASPGDSDWKYMRRIFLAVSFVFWPLIVVFFVVMLPLVLLWFPVHRFFTGDWP